MDSAEVLSVFSNPGPLMPGLKMGSAGALVSSVQQVLKDKGYYEGVVDGLLGWRTCKAVVRFQLNRPGCSPTAVVDGATFSALGIAPDSIG